MSRSIISTLHKILFEESNKRWDMRVMKHAWGNETCIALVWETRTKRPFGIPRHIRVEDIKADLQETEWQTWIGLIWLRTGTCGRFLLTSWNFGFDKTWKVCWLAKELLPSQGLYCMQLSSQSVSQSVGYLSLGIYFLFPVFTEEVLFLYTHKHTTLTMLSSIIQNFSSSLCTTILEVWLPGVAEFAVSVTKRLTRTWHSSRHLINVSERKYTDHIHVVKHATLHRLTHAHFYQALTLNNATTKCEQQCKPKTVCYKNMAKFI